MCIVLSFHNKGKLLLKKVHFLVLEGLMLQLLNCCDLKCIIKCTKDIFLITAFTEMRKVTGLIIETNLSLPAFFRIK